MSNPETNNENPEIFNLIINDDLKNTGLFESGTFNRRTEIIEVFVNHKVNGPVSWTLNRKTWTKNFELFWEQMQEYGEQDSNTKLQCRRLLNNNQKEILKDFNNGKSQSGEEEKEEVKPEIKIYKYSQNGRGDLYESVIVDGFPRFLRYNHTEQKFDLFEDIEESNRILKPPQNSEDYPYTPFEFQSEEEIGIYLERARTTTLDEIYLWCKSIFQKYVDNKPHVIIMLTTDSIWTWFQDLFSTTHYGEGVGTNDVGKSSLGYTFEYTGYRVVKGTAISGANYNRILGSIEPGQCVIIEDEGDSISEDPDKVRLLKAGYEKNSRIPKINMNTTNQAQTWYRPYCYKLILAEKSLKEYNAPGLVDRTYSFKCKPGRVKYKIKEVVNEKANKPKRLQKLYDELIAYRKLMLCYRLIHYKDQIPEISTGLENRDNELCKPALQLFYGTEALKKEIIPALETFVKQRRDRKSNTLEAAIYPIIKKIFLDKYGTNSLKDITDKRNERVDYYKIWNKIIGRPGGEIREKDDIEPIEPAIDGTYDDRKPNDYETFAYDTLHRNTLSSFIADAFAGTIDRKAKGSVLIFDVEEFEKYDILYGNSNVKINVEKLEEDEKEEEQAGGGVL